MPDQHQKPFWRISAVWPVGRNVRLLLLYLFNAIFLGRAIARPIGRHERPGRLPVKPGRIVRPAPQANCVNQVLAPPRPRPYASLARSAASAIARGRFGRNVLTAPVSSRPSQRRTSSSKARVVAIRPQGVSLGPPPCRLSPPRRRE